MRLASRGSAQAVPMMLRMKGGGGCTFEPANRLWSLDGGSKWTTAFAATFEAGQRFPTLAFGHYVDRSQPGSPWGTTAPQTIDPNTGTPYGSRYPWVTVEDMVAAQRPRPLRAPAQARSIGGGREISMTIRGVRSRPKPHRSVAKSPR